MEIQILLVSFMAKKESLEQLSCCSTEITVYWAFRSCLYFCTSLHSLGV